MVGQIRLAWWRERLEELGAGKYVPHEPRLEAAERELVSRGVKGSELAQLERGWVSLFDQFPWDTGPAEAIWFRGRLLFALGADLCDRTDDSIEGAGGLWALVDAARHISDGESREMLMSQARTFAKGLSGTRFSAKLRPLSMLAGLAMRDIAKWPAVEPEGTPGRALAMLRHRLTGRLILRG